MLPLPFIATAFHPGRLLCPSSRVAGDTAVEHVVMWRMCCVWRGG